MSKVTKASVHYSLGHMHSHCGPTFHYDKSFCTHYISGSGRIGTCARVEGKIDSRYWCELWRRAARST